MRKEIIVILAILLIALAALVFVSIDRTIRQPEVSGERTETGESVKNFKLVDINISLNRFGSYDDLLDYLNNYLNSVNQFNTVYSGSIEPVVNIIRPLVGAIPKDESSTFNKIESRYSQTNVQVLGIDEPDFVKTNGYLLVVYSIESSKVYIIDLEKDEIVGNISIERDLQLHGLYIVEDYLVIIVSNPIYRILGFTEKYPFFNNYDVETFIYVYSIREPENPVLLLNTSVTGLAFDSRLFNKTLYIVTQMPIIFPLIPRFNNSYVPVDRIFVLIDKPEYYVTIVALDIVNFNYNVLSFIVNRINWIYMSYSRIYLAITRGFIDLYSVFSETYSELTKYLPNDIAGKINDTISKGDFYSAINILSEYLSQEDERVIADIIDKINSYVMNRFYGDRTIFYLFNIENVNITYKGSFNVEGIILDQFSMEEIDNKYFVVATTSHYYRFLYRVYEGFILENNSTEIDRTESNKWSYVKRIFIYPYITNTTESNNVFVIDTDSLKTIGVLRGIALGERIYAARLINKILYLVTFRTIDPLFAIDLSNPENPVILGYLKIPGFSEYLHPLSSDKLLGIGLENRSLKISIFDTSDPKRLSEISKILLNNSYSNVLYDYHGFTIDYDNNRFYIQIYQWNDSKFISGIAVFSYENYELKIIKILEHMHAYRTVYVGDRLYTIGPISVRVFDIHTLDFLKEIQFQSRQEYLTTIEIETYNIR
ncbi:MAG: beta-propeller domain-containing protein [Desulfurococcaceae archaeon]